MTEGLAREMELFREALELPTVGMRQVGDLELLRSLIHQYPAQAKRYVDEVYGWRQDGSASPVTRLSGLPRRPTATAARESGSQSWPGRGQDKATRRGTGDLPCIAGPGRRGCASTPRGPAVAEGGRGPDQPAHTHVHPRRPCGRRGAWEESRRLRAPRRPPQSAHGSGMPARWHPGSWVTSPDPGRLEAEPQE